MSKQRTFQPKIDTLSLLSSALKYDITRPIALYGRHSTKEQDGNIATTQQTVGLEKLAFRLGFAQELHRTFYEDLRGISAYKVPMDERKSYSELYNAIARGEIGTVLCYLVDRLFRTKNGEEWELFINACVKNNVKVITSASPMRVYDLSISSDADDFRQKCIAARTYIEEIIKGRLNAARDELGLMGLWAGQGVPVGFYVDLDKESPMYQHYLIYEPHATIVRALFKRFRELNGSFSKLMREIEARQPLFPLFEDLEKLPNTQLSMNAEKTGYTLGSVGLLSILTNPMYIGTYTYQGQTREDNHPVIVNRDDFFYAFDRLSRFDLDGNEKETTRTRTQGYSSSASALLRDKLTSEAFSHVYVHSPQKIYVFQQKIRSFSLHIMRVPIATLDGVVSDQLVSMLELWKNFMGKRTPPMYGLPMSLYNAFETVSNASETVIASIDDQIPALKARIAKLRRNLDLDADAETLADWAKELKEKVKELARLEAKQKVIAESQSAQEDAARLIACVPDEWQAMSFEKRRRVIDLLLENAEVTEEAAHFLRLTLTWKLPMEHVQTLYIYRRNGTSYAWTEEEEDIIRKHYAKTSIHDMLALLPCRTWATIKTQAVSMDLHRNSGTPCDVPKTLSYEDMQFMRMHGIDNLDAKASVQVFHGGGDRKAVSLSRSRI